MPALAFPSHRFAQDQQGSVAVVFGLMATVLIFAMGIAVDYARVIHAKARIAAAADAAVLASGRALLDGVRTDAQVRALAASYFAQNLASGGNAFAQIGTPRVTLNRSTGSVLLDVVSSVPMTLTRIAGFERIEIPVRSAVNFAQSDIEVGMALDVTGSMNEVVAGEAKIDSLKMAFEKFVDRLMPAGRQSVNRVRIGFAPYSSTVNLGPYADAASLGRSADGCVQERSGGAFSDDLPSGPWRQRRPVEGAFETRADGGRGSYLCPSPEVEPLSADRDELVRQVRSFRADGSTAGHIGVQWAWNLVSENWNGVWGSSGAPDSYSRVADEKLIKAVVLMTDGEFNTAFRYGTSPAQAVELCDAMKRRGVKVFSVAFDAPTDAQRTLKACASSGVEYYANAANGAELEAAFTKFAVTLGQLRLTQ